jgi:hypothetical protein
MRCPSLKERDGLIFCPKNFLAPSRRSAIVRKTESSQREVFLEKTPIRRYVSCGLVNML